MDCDPAAPGWLRQFLYHLAAVQGRCGVQRQGRGGGRHLSLSLTARHTLSQVGFGRPDGEYWLGLEPVHQLTSRGDHELLVLLEDWGGRGARALYDNFSLEPESDHYRLRLGQYHGDAGDSLSWHNDKPFSTVDRDRDSYSGEEPCSSGG